MTEKQEEFDYPSNDGEGMFAVNNAAIYFDEGNLVVAYGDGNLVTMELEREDEREIVRKIVDDPNTWAAFLGSLSAALKKHV